MTASPPSSRAAEASRTRDDAALRRVFDRCYREHRDRIFQLCLRFGAGRRDWAEDVTHDVFVKLYERLADLADHEDLGGWLYRVAANHSISRLRREQGWLGKLKQLIVAKSAAPTDEVVAGKQRAARALATLDQLPPKERVVICMKILDGKSQREIAETLEMSEGYVSKLVTRALARIRDDGWEGGDDE
ncbi:MAG: sigma-70 family RNA polymerase sigma factor [Polyangiaceae bacterium]